MNWSRLTARVRRRVWSACSFEFPYRCCGSTCTCASPDLRLLAAVLAGLRRW
ncbi:hypothetical protein [Saccharopolyspora sp. CA-218241]|uniref:hypothetical protein n=1 Tax=Saccharopolyspora sp. CA-218241 TaxID=3240027 RepID=UPI003D98DA16